MAKKPVARANHDLNHVHTLLVRGWSGAHKVVEDAPGDRVEIVAQKRHEGDSLTFREPRGGVLVCHASPSADQSQQTTHDPADGEEWRMVIKVPLTKRGLLIQVD